MGSEVAARASFSKVRYAQCWEDTDILLAALGIQSGEVCLSIASAGDNVLSMLSQSPAKVVALDLSGAQLACLELRVSAYRNLSYEDLLILIGSSGKNQLTQQELGKYRILLYRRCWGDLSVGVKEFWDSRLADIAQGIGTIGKFERYFEVFRRWVLPLVHGCDRISTLLQDKPLQSRLEFYEQVWNNWQWQFMFKLFFSRLVMGRLGRDPSFFQYVEGSVAEKILARTRYALTELNPAENPYLQWILTGEYQTALPYALRPENFEAIRANLDRLEWRCCSLEDYLDEVGEQSVSRYNLSDIFEYMSAENYQRLLRRLVKAGKSGGRLVYWNMLTPRSCPEEMLDLLRPLPMAQSLHQQDKAFFYSRFVVEEIL